MPEPTAKPAQTVVAVDEPEAVASDNVNDIAGLPELTAQLRRLNDHLSRKTSLRFLFAAALLQGLGYLLGATLVASVLFAIIVRFLTTLNFPVMINDLIRSIEVPGMNQQIDFRQYPF